jgi:hypothetical protein
LDNARNQLGSAPEVADKAAQMFNTLGNNLNAVREKSAEFAFGLLSELLPNLVAVTDRLANIDAAGIGAKLSEYAKATLDWAVETFKLGEALTNAELAFKAITSGEIGDGLKLMFLTARDTALNAVNEIFANAKAAVQTFSGIMAKLFDTSGALFFTASTLIEMLSAKITSAFAGAVAGIVRAMGPAFEKIADGIEYQAETAERTFGMLAKGIGAQFELVGDQLKEVIAEAPQEFRKNYESNIKDPLIEMESRMAETASHAAKVQENLEGAARAMMQISDAAPTLDSPSPSIPSVADIGNTIADAFGGGSTPASGSGGGSSPSGRVSMQRSSSSSARGGGGSGVDMEWANKEREKKQKEGDLTIKRIGNQMNAAEQFDPDAQARMMLSGGSSQQQNALANVMERIAGIYPDLPPESIRRLAHHATTTPLSSSPGEMRSGPRLGDRNLDRAEELQRQGMTKSAQRQREQSERLQDKQRQRDANRELQKDLGLRSDARMSPEQIARQEGKVSPLDRDAFDKRVKEIEQEIKDRAGQGDGTQNTSSAPGGGDGKSGESSLEKLVGEIKSLVEKIEPKLPTHALA